MNNSPKKLGRYNILREVGRGAMGVVYKAHDPVIEREVAIKAIQLSFQVSSDEKKVYLNRFYREAKAAGKLNHPNIVTIYDVNEDKESGTPFIVMEFLEGTTLQEIIASGILLPVEDVNQIMMQMADGLHYAHKQQVVHRDIKSANILILEGMKVKITDFGIARIASSDLTKTGQFIGTPNYMSPEQLEGKVQVDGRSDLFSLGVIAYLLLTGERPFSGDSFTSISYKIVHVNPIPPRTLNPSVPDHYNKILSKLLAKDPNERYPDGAELIKDLKNAMNIDSGIPEVRAIPLDEVTVFAVSPGAADVAKQNASMSSSRESIASHQTMTIVDRLSFSPVKIGAVALAALLLLGWLWFFFSKSDHPEAPPLQARPQAGEPSQTFSRQNRIRNKWDLATNYYRNGLFDRAEEELEELLKMDPTHTEARKFLELVRERQKPGAPAVPLPDVPPSVLNEGPPDVDTQPAPVEKDAPAKPLPGGTHRVSFEFEHALPSGNLYIYQKDRLIYEAPLYAEKSKVLLFPVNKGKLTGSIKLPVGETKLLFRLVCREQGVSAVKETVAKISPSGQTSLRIRYSKTAHQLEIRWI